MTFVKWGTNIQANLLTIRNILKTTHYTFFEDYLENGLLANFTDIDSCLTQAYDQRLSGNNPPKALKECKFSKKIQTALDCGYAFTEGLFIVGGAIDFSEDNAQDLKYVKSKIIANCRKVR